MNERPSTPDDASATDPVVSAALRSMVAPEHGPTFWDRLDAELGDGPVTAPTAVVPPPEPPVPPPLAEVGPLLPRRRPARPWWLAVAAILVAALGVAALVRTTSTDVETTPAATAVPVETTLAPTTSAPVPTTAPPTTAAPKPTVAPTTTARVTTTTTRPTPLTISPTGLGPLKLGMTITQAEATGAVGPYHDPLDRGEQCGYAEPAGAYRSEDFSVMYLDGRLARFYIGKGSRIRTPQGVGTGSPASKLSSVPGTRVESPHPYGGGTNIDITTGDVGYQFTVDQGVVTEWSVGTKGALAAPEGCA